MAGIHEVYTYKERQASQNTLRTNDDSLQQQISSCRFEEQILLAKLAACQAQLVVLQQRIKTEAAPASWTCPDSPCPRRTKAFPNFKDLLRHYCGHIPCEEICRSCSRTFDRVSKFTRHELACKDLKKSPEALKRHKILAEGLTQKAKCVLDREIAVRTAVDPVVEKVTGQLLPKRRPVNSISDSSQPYKKARFDSDSAETFILNAGQEVMSTSSDMRQTFGEAEKPPQRAQLDSCELLEASTSDSKQGDTPANPLGLRRLNIDQAGRPVSEHHSQEPTRGNLSDYLPPALFRTPASAPTLRTPLPSLTNAIPISQLPELASPPATPATFWDRHRILRGEEDGRNNGSSDTSPAASGSPTSTAEATTSISRSLTEYSHFSPSESLSSPGGAITASQSSQIPFYTAVLASLGETEHSPAVINAGITISAATSGASTAGSWPSIATTNMAGITNTTGVELTGFVSGAQERSLLTTYLPAVCDAKDLQPPTPPPQPSSHLYISHPVVQTLPMYPINPTSSTRKENLYWGEIFITTNFGVGEVMDGVEDGVLADSVPAHGLVEEYLRPNQSEAAVEDIAELRKEGFVHWKDQHIGSRIQLKSKAETSSFWASDGWGILNSILANPRIQGILSDWFKGPCVIAHWLRWGIFSTKGAPTFLARNAVESESDVPYLGLHVMCAETGVKCYARSHHKAWPPVNQTWFTNSTEALQAHNVSEEMSNGFIVFDPRTNFRFVEGSAMTIIFGTRDSVRTWKPLKVSHPSTKKLFERMEAAGVGFNFEFVEGGTTASGAAGS